MKALQKEPQNIPNIGLANDVKKKVYEEETKFFLYCCP